MKTLLYFFNAMALVLLYTYFLYQSDYFNTPFFVLLLLLGYSFFIYFRPKRWSLILYHSIFILIYAGVLLTSPMGITFALIGGLILTIKVLLLFYLPALLLLIWNIQQIRQCK